MISDLAKSKKRIFFFFQVHSHNPITSNGFIDFGWNFPKKIPFWAKINIGKFQLKRNNFKSGRRRNRGLEKHNSLNHMFMMKVILFTLTEGNCLRFFRIKEIELPSQVLSMYITSYVFNSSHFILLASYKEKCIFQRNCWKSFLKSSQESFLKVPKRATGRLIALC